MPAGDLGDVGRPDDRLGTVHCRPGGPCKETPTLPSGFPVHGSRYAVSGLTNQHRDTRKKHIRELMSLTGDLNIRPPVGEVTQAAVLCRRTRLSLPHRGKPTTPPECKGGSVPRALWSPESQRFRPPLRPQRSGLLRCEWPYAILGYGHRSIQVNFFPMVCQSFSWSWYRCSP